MKNLNITISGQATTGNSYLVYEIRRLLRENGWNVEHDYGSEDNETEVDLDVVQLGNLDEKISRVKNNTIVIINEKQLRRMPTE